MAASAAKYCEKGAVNQSAASAASPDYVNFQAVIKSAASAASQKGQIKETKTQGSAWATARLAPGDGLGALPWVLVSLIWLLGRLR